MARPTLAADGSKSVLIQTKLTREDAALLKEKAGLVPVAAFVRELVLAGINDEDDADK